MKLPELEVVWAGSSWRESEPAPARPAVVEELPKEGHHVDRPLGKRQLLALRGLATIGPATAKRLALFLGWTQSVTQDAICNAVRYRGSAEVVEVHGSNHEAVYAITPVGVRLLAHPINAREPGEQVRRGKVVKRSPEVIKRQRAATQKWIQANPNYHRAYRENRKRKMAEEVGLGTR